MTSTHSNRQSRQTLLSTLSHFFLTPQSHLPTDQTAKFNIWKFALSGYLSIFSAQRRPQYAFPTKPQHAYPTGSSRPIRLNRTIEEKSSKRHSMPALFQQVEKSIPLTSHFIKAFPTPSSSSSPDATTSLAYTSSSPAVSHQTHFPHQSSLPAPTPA
jgi:hypothetical protein